MPAPRPKLSLNSLEDYLIRLKRTINAIQKQIPIIDGGVVSIVIATANTPQTATFSYNCAFENIPVVVATSDGTSSVNSTTISSKTLTTFTISVLSTVAGMRTVEWLAYDPS